MNREQKALAVVTIILIILILGLSVATYHQWKKRQSPDLAVSFYNPEIEGTSGLQIGFTTVNLYYYNPQHGSLERVQTSLPLDPTQENMNRLIELTFEQLKAPPSGEDLISALPKDSAFRSIFIDYQHRSVYLNLNEDFFKNHPRATLEGWASIYCIVNSICSVSAKIEQVFFLRDGHTIDEGPGGWDYSHPYRAKESD